MRASPVNSTVLAVLLKPRAWAHLGRRKTWMGSPLQSPGGWRAGKALDLIWLERWEYVYSISIHNMYIYCYII